jgi:hypothetical protein
MSEADKITVEFSIKEAEILCRAIQGYSPPIYEELISIMLYNRIKNKIDLTIKKI